MSFDVKERALKMIEAKEEQMRSFKEKAEKERMKPFIEKLINSNEDILMNNKTITNLALPIRARLGLGYLTQEASIFRDLTVKENIDLALQNSFFSSREKNMK